jgi:hypothetical protein
LVAQIIYTITHLSMLVSNVFNIMYILIYIAMCLLAINVMINSAESEDQTTGVRPEMPNDSQYAGDMFDVQEITQRDKVSRPAQPMNRPIQPMNRPVQPMNRPVQPRNTILNGKELDDSDDILG